MSANTDLINKYNVNIPRYTSYPPLPVWNTSDFTSERYFEHLQFAVRENNHRVSVYIHLPYCESLCTYCGCNTRITVNHSVETPYINAIIKEWELITELIGQSLIIDELHLGGGTPTFFSPQNLKTMIEGIKSFAVFSADADLSFEGHPNNTTREHLKVLRQCGFNRVSFGVQDFDLRVQKAINRVQPFENVRNVVQWSRELGYKSVNLDLVYGLPFQTMDSMEETIQKVIELKPDRIAFYGYAHVPWVKPGQRSFSEEDLPDDETKQLLFEAGKRKFIEAGYSRLGFDHFALPDEDLAVAFRNGKLNRNFMGYTTTRSNVLIGLGVSSISDCSYAFAQNPKVVEDYLAQINANELRFIKGHIQSTVDIQVGKAIKELMCNLKVKRIQVDPFIEQHQDVHRKIQTFIAEGLLYKTSDEYRVTEAGRTFLRNICAAIDPYLTQEVAVNKFSKAI